MLMFAYCSELQRNPFAGWKLADDDMSQTLRIVNDNYLKRGGHGVIGLSVKPSGLE